MAGFGRILREALKRLMESRGGAAKAVEGVEDDALLNSIRGMDLDRSDVDRLSTLGREDIPTPEKFLGRPLTPDHIWNDPRFSERYALTYPLEGVYSPAQRFEIAGERIGEELGERLGRERELTRMSPNHDMESIIGMGRHSSPREFAEILDADLGAYAVGGTQEKTPLLGIALAGGMGGGLTLREALRNRQRNA